ncbi:MFS transporter permease [Vibrio sp. HA2012]|uniref:multidrug effflux MFS transporter n=1 Tax=Vibrio sp. HA2012 TaxID=1971595 RepID=UPI000C2C1917|nr:multidrug effflux MFS transporter [Vibrio sp. HA2012]PJC87096.1 MFS transporter permease [Vibrio sp. HA2012]
MSQKTFVLLMAMIMGVSPFAVDAYLPAMPYMSDYFSVGPDKVAATISFYILGMAIGQIFGGPLADTFGKRRLILSGLSLYILSTLIIAQSDSLLPVQIFRVIQAIGGGFSIVCVPALIRERAVGNEAAKIFALVALIMVAAPALAPSVGALILLVGNWQMIFYFLAIYALLVLVFAASKLPADKPEQIQKTSAVKRYAYVLRNRPALRYIAVQGFGQSVMMVFVTNASFIYQQYFGLDDQVFALVFAMNVVMVAIVNRINSRLLAKYPAQTLLGWALKVQAIFVALFVVCIVLDAPVQIQAISIICMIGSLGAVMPNSNAVYISHFREHLGSASALFGANQFLTSSIAGGLTTVFYNGTLWPIAIMMIFLTVTANLMMPANKH